MMAVDEDGPTGKACFDDDQGRRWRVRIPMRLYRRWRDERGLDLMDPQHAAKLADDPVARSECIIGCLEDQGKAHGMTFDDIDDMLADDPNTLIAAHEAFEVAWANFTLASRRPEISMVLTKIRKAAKMQSDVTMRHLSSQRMEALVDQAMQTAEAEMDRIMTAADSTTSSKGIAESSGPEATT